MGQHRMSKSDGGGYYYRGKYIAVDRQVRGWGRYLIVGFLGEGIHETLRDARAAIDKYLDRK